MSSKPYTIFALFVSIAMFASCENKKASKLHLKQASKASPIVNTNLPRAPIMIDTLQFIHFEGNFDYWSGVFLNAKKDTIILVTDTIVPSVFKNKLLEVKSFVDTLYEAGDNDGKYTARRMLQFRPLKGKPFVAPITEQQILSDVKKIPEVSGGADHVGIAQRPTDEKTYYVVETGTHNEDNHSRFATFRVYVYPRYEIRVYDPAGDTDISLDQWRRR